MAEFSVKRTAPRPFWLDCDSCLHDGAKGEDCRAEFAVMYGDDVVTRLCKSHAFELANVMHVLVFCGLDDGEES